MVWTTLNNEFKVFRHAVETYPTIVALYRSDGSDSF